MTLPRAERRRQFRVLDRFRDGVLTEARSLETPQTMEAVFGDDLLSVAGEVRDGVSSGKAVSPTGEAASSELEAADSVKTCSAKGALLVKSTLGRRFSVLGCGRWDCENCGQRKRWNILARHYQAWLRVFPADLYRHWMLTLTLRTKAKSETWDDYVSDHDVPVDDCHLEILYADAVVGAHDRPSDVRGRVFYEALMTIHRTMGMRAMVWAREQLLSAQEYQSVLSYVWQRIGKRYARKFGGTRPGDRSRLSYVGSLEFTKQAVPHFHFALPVELHDFEWRIENEGWWFRQQWMQFWPDVEFRGVHYDAEFTGAKTKLPSGEEVEIRTQSLVGALGYVLKYVLKMDVPHHWNETRLRRYRRSSNMSLPEVGELDKFRMIGTDRVFNWKRFRRIKARVRYYEGRTADGLDTSCSQWVKYRHAVNELEVLEAERDRVIRQVTAVFGEDASQAIMYHSNCSCCDDDEPPVVVWQQWGHEETVYDLADDGFRFTKRFGEVMDVPAPPKRRGPVIQYVERL